MQDYEKLGLFYLGRPLGEDGEPLDAPLLYDARESPSAARPSSWAATLPARSGSAAIAPVCARAT